MVVKIECVLYREGGTEVELGGKKYHFKPQADGKHVAEVADKHHAARLLSISEAYRPLPCEKIPAAPASTTDEEAPAVDESALIGSGTLPSFVDVLGKDVALGDIVRGAFEVSGLTVDEWNALDADERDTRLLDHVDLLNAEPAELTPAQKRAATMAAKKAAK
jgi:hypothetical protein